MKTSIFVCPLNVVKITLQKRKWTFTTDVFKVSVKKHKHSVRKKKKEKLVSKTLFTIVTTMEPRTESVIVQCLVRTPLCVARVGHLAVAAALPLGSLP